MLLAASIRAGLDLEHAVVFLDGTLEGIAGDGAVGMALGDGEQEVAEVEMGGGGIELVRGLPGQGEGQFELAGPVETDGQCEDHAALVIAATDVVGDAAGLGQVGRNGGLIPGPPLRQQLDELAGRDSVSRVGLKVGLQHGDRGGAIPLRNRRSPSPPRFGFR